nr:uncharacterized protein LOC128676707 [Plodia interpunctella]
MSKNADKESTSAYALPSQQDDPVTTMCKLVEDDTPQPMRGMKKSIKVSTAAEQFSTDHHGEYEARARQSCGKIGRVHRHNAACPMLYDELQKKTSTSRVVAVTMSRKDALHLTNSNAKRRTNTTAGRGRNKKSKEKQRTMRNKLMKRRKPNRHASTNKRAYRLSKIFKSKGCQCHPGSCEDDNTNDVMVWTRSTLNKQSRTSQRSGSYVTEKFPGTSHTSVSSYHSSFSSMAQEPMVS